MSTGEIFKIKQNIQIFERVLKVIHYDASISQEGI